MSDEFRPSAYIEDTIRISRRLQAEHDGGATAYMRFAHRVVDLLGRPTCVIVLLGGAAAWIIVNLAMLALGRAPLDPPPFAWLQLTASICALCVTVLILTRQYWDDALAGRRGQMTLELAILSEQRLAKIIQLLEEYRSDNPLIDNRVDASAEAMATPVDPHALNASATEIGGRGDRRRL